MALAFSFSAVAGFSLVLCLGHIDWGQWKHEDDDPRGGLWLSAAEEGLGAACAPPAVPWRAASSVWPAAKGQPESGADEEEDKVQQDDDVNALVQVIASN